MITSHRRRQAFTLIEILVVVAIIALLIAILLPSLAMAREQARAAQCMSNCRQMAAGTLMYAGDNRGYLFGPGHIGVFVNTSDWVEGSANQPLAERYAKSNMGFAIAKYMGDRRAKNLDKVAVCPTSVRIPRASSQGQPWINSKDIYYITNTGTNGRFAKNWTGAPVSGASLYNTWGSKPYYSTKLPNYFGYTNASAAEYADPAGYLHPYSLPKQVDKIPLNSREWMVADIWTWQATKAGGRGGTNLPMGPFSLQSGGGDLASFFNNNIPKIPTYPFHNTTKTYQNEFLRASGSDVLSNSERLTTGRTNMGFFDGHAASTLGWQGTANPCFKPVSGVTPPNQCGEGPNG